MKLMSNTYALRTALAALVMSATSLAQAEPQYPEEFVPSVVYRDAELIAKHNKPIETAIPSPTSKATASSGKVLGQPDQPVTADYLVYGAAAALFGFVIWSSRRKS